MSYRLYTGPKDSSLYGVLTSAPYKNVMKNNVNINTSFNSIEVSLEKTLNESNTAFLYFGSAVSYMKKYQCKVCIL